jgi:putative ABC transport system substrate-binding protein
MEAVPRARRIAALADAKAMQSQHLRQYKDAARTHGVELAIIAVNGPHEIVPAIDGAKASGAEAINVLATPLFGSYQARGIVLERIAALRLPAIFQWPDMADEGGLLAYGPSFIELSRQRARMVAKVLRGSKPADIPVEQPTRFELVVNVKAAKAIGHEIPAGLVLRADRLIE